MNVLFSFNKNFLENEEEMIFSLLYYSSENICLYLMYLENEISKEDIKYMSEFVSRTGKGKMIPIKFDTTSINQMPVDDGDGNFFGLEAYSRIFCAFLLPDEVEKILYMDADMVCTGDIKEIYDINLEGRLLGASKDLGIMPKDLKRLGLPIDYPYINSGMLLIDVKKQRPAKITDEMAQKYKLFEKSVFEEEPKGKLSEQENMQKIYEYIAVRRDIDANHHVNNVVYLELAYNALPQDIKMDLKNVEIYYKKQIKIGEEISIYAKQENNVHTVCIKSKDEKDLHAILKFY